MTMILIILTDVAKLVKWNPLTHVQVSKVRCQFVLPFEATVSASHLMRFETMVIY